MPGRSDPPDTESGQEKWLELNTNFSAEWPNITRKKDSPADADEHKGEEGKYDKYLHARRPAPATDGNPDRPVGGSPYR